MSGSAPKAAVRAARVRHESDGKMQGGWHRSMVAGRMKGATQGHWSAWAGKEREGSKAQHSGRGSKEAGEGGGVTHA